MYDIHHVNQSNDYNMLMPQDRFSKRLKALLLLSITSSVFAYITIATMTLRGYQGFATNYTPSSQSNIYFTYKYSTEISLIYGTRFILATLGAIILIA
jgi:hypothetical protein